MNMENNKGTFISAQELTERRKLNAISRDMSMMTKMLLAQTKMLRMAVTELRFISGFSEISPTVRAHIIDCLERIKSMAE